MPSMYFDFEWKENKFINRKSLLEYILKTIFLILYQNTLHIAIPALFVI